MTGDEQRGPQFDERAAEAELERVRAALEEWRQKRKQASESFDSFLREFDRSGRGARPLSPRVPDRRADASDSVPLAAPVIRPRPVDPPIETTQLPPAPPVQKITAPEPGPQAAVSVPEPVRDVFPPATSALDDRDGVAVSADSTMSGPRRFGPRRAAAALAIVVALSALFLWRPRSRAPDLPVTATPTTPAPSPAQVPAAGPPAPAPATGFQVELTTLRRVWLRVIVDGERTIEREVPEGERIPLNPQKTVTIRAGDAGALRVVVGGKDVGPFGTDGFPATRTFTPPQ